MSTGIGLNKVEVTSSNSLGGAAYRIEFNLSDHEGPFGFITADKLGQPRSNTSGTVAVEIPVDQTSEAEVFAKAREVLHVALTRLADAVKPPAPR